MKFREYQLQKAICQYLDLQFPDVLYLSDTVAQVKLTMPQAARNKAIQKSGFKVPDLLILEPRNGWHGLFIELKTKSPFKKDGNLYENEHLKGQATTIGKLTEKGYLACFSWSFHQTKKIIDDYLKIKNPPLRDTNTYIENGKNQKGQSRFQNSIFRNG